MQLPAANAQVRADLSAPALAAGRVAADALPVAEVGEGPGCSPGLQVARHPHGRAHLQPVVHPRFGQVIVGQALLGLKERKRAHVQNKFRQITKYWNSVH